MKVVIYTQRVEVVERYQERRDCVDQRVANFIAMCGFLPIPVPNKEELAEKIISRIRPSGIILTGGNSLVSYGGNAPERDAMDKALIKIAIKNFIPLYGFCRGMQSILDYFGCKLVDVDGHVAVRHQIYEGTGQYEVNSYHNQACIYLKRDCGLRMLSYTEDGVIESICHESLPIVATMWHPEREKQIVDRDANRIKTLFDKKKIMYDK